jgi:DNA polymerase-3 subunit alpha
MNKDFVHLHIHTEYSLLDGALKCKNLMERAKKYNFSAIGITDHGAMYGIIDFYETAKNYGIKPILGIEIYLTSGSRFEKTSKNNPLFHLILIAENEEGYKNLIKISTLGFLEGFYYKPRVDKELLSKYHRGIIALTSCLKGEIPTLILEDKIEEAKKKAGEYQEIFGKENFYFELQDQNLQEQKKLNNTLIELSKKLSIPLVATNDVHYLEKKDAYPHDVLLCIQTQTTLDQKQRMRFNSDEFYFKSAEEMWEIFKDIPESIKNTKEIASRCNVNLEFDKVLLPDYKLSLEFNSPEEYLRKLAEEGLKNKYKKITEDLRNRLEYELKIITEKGFASYFLIIRDIVKFAKEKGIPVGPGRGSAAGCLTSYVLGITNIDPISYNLFFERFLNPERKSFPDIDLDFCDKRRDEVIQYIIEKYGKDKVAQIITFGTMAARAAIRDVGRVLKIPYPQVDKIAKVIPQNISIEEALEIIPEFRNFYESEPLYKKLIDTAKSIEGLIRHASTHAAGIVISPFPLIEYVPLQRTEAGIFTTQYSMDALAKIGLLKMDILGLRNLSVIEESVSLVERRRGIKLKIEEIPLDDEKTYQLLSSGNTLGVFQMESQGMRNLLRELKPEKIQDIIALIALYRPGPLRSGMPSDFIKRKQGIVPIVYPHPKLESILKETYGVIIYQEQVMQIANILSGFTLSQGEILMKAMSKKKPEEMEKLKDAFIEGAQKNKISKKKAEQIYELMEKFAGYGFNKSHSAAYALIAYQTAYLKANYPLEFMTALLNSVSDNLDDVAKYVRECENLNIPVLTPDINESDVNFSIVDNSIRFGLSAIKNVGKAAEEIVKTRKREGIFSSISDFLEKVDLRVVNKKVIESLGKAGVFDSIEKNRALLLNKLDKILQDAQEKKSKKSLAQQTSLFPEIEFEEKEVEEDSKNFSEEELLSMEKEMLGIYVSSHPLKNIQDKVKKIITHNFEELSEIPDGTDTTVVGIINSLKKIKDKNGNNMVFLQLEDLTGKGEVIVFPKIYEKCYSFLKPDKIIIVRGKINKKDVFLSKIGEKEEIKIIAENIFPFEGAEEIEKENNMKKIFHIYIDENSREIMENLKSILKKYPGNNKVFLNLKDNSQEVVIQLPDEFCVNCSEELLNELGKIFPKENIFIEEEISDGYN